MSVHDSTKDEIVSEVINAYKGVSAVQRRFNYKQPMGVYNWRARGIPRSLIADIHIDTGIPIIRLQQAQASAAA